METYKFTVKKEQEVEKEIQLPFYSKDENKYFKIFASEDKVFEMSVYLNTASTLVDVFDITVCNNRGRTATPCTEQEFTEQFVKAIDILSKNVDLLVSVNPLPEPEEIEESETVNNS